MQQQASTTEQIVVDGMAVDLFNADMQLKGIWVFRGPIMHTEKQLFLDYDRQQAAAEAAQAAGEQEAIRAARRAQREQQVGVWVCWSGKRRQGADGATSTVVRCVCTGGILKRASSEGRLDLPH